MMPFSIRYDLRGEQSIAVQNTLRGLQEVIA